MPPRGSPRPTTSPSASAIPAPKSRSRTTPRTSASTASTTGAGQLDLHRHVRALRRQERPHAVHKREELRELPRLLDPGWRIDPTGQLVRFGRVRAKADHLELTGPSTLGRVSMAKLIYSAITSLDGYVPDEEVHTFVNDLERPVGTYLYGRRMYEVMVYWETAHTLADQPPFVQDFAEIWQAADKIEYSKTLETVSSARTRIERDFDPEAVRQMKAPAGRDITVGGPDLAAQAIKAVLVDECHLFVAPIVVGGGKVSLPNNVRLKLELLDERRFGNGVVHLHYRTGT